jgi:signal transduction histidine kinase/CheY-like chemotaxis protein
VQFVETQLAGAIGSASARVMVASVVEEEALALDDVLRILDEASQLRRYSHALEQATADLRAANERLEEPGPAEGRLHVQRHARAAHAADKHPRAGRADGRRPDMPVEQRQQFLGIVVAETERLSRLVNQVLDMAKIESGHGEWHDTEVDLIALLRQAAQTVHELLRERGAELVLDLPQSAPPLMADADRLMQVVLNLLSNAAKFVPAGRGRIELRLRVAPGTLTVEVQDNGPGVPAAQRALIFEKFRQGGDAANRPQGTGLGLPISRQIVEHFGGRMELRPDTGQGACFCLHATLPFQPGADTPGCTDGRRRRQPMTTRILIADDEPNILISLEYLMKRQGYEVFVARDGQEALDLLRAHLPRLVLLDVMMPRKSGFEVCQELRADEAIKDTLVLMLTAKGRDTDVAKGLGVGADAYMTKPFSTKELVQKVADLLAAGRAAA